MGRFPHTTLLGSMLLVSAGTAVPVTRMNDAFAGDAGTLPLRRRRLTAYPPIVI